MWLFFFLVDFLCATFWTFGDTNIGVLMNGQENGEESFEELQQLFEDMFQADIGISASDSHTAASCSTSSTYVSYAETTAGGSNKRNSSEMNVGKNMDSSAHFEASFQDFCLGVSIYAFLKCSLSYCMYDH